MRHTSQHSNAKVQAVHDSEVDFRASAQLATLHSRKRAKNEVEADEVEVVGQEDQDKEHWNQLSCQVHNQQSEQLKAKKTKE